VAKPVPSQNSITLDQVNIVLDVEGKTVKIVCSDEQLNGSFALGVQKGGKLERDLLNLLAQHNINLPLKAPAPQKVADSSLIIPIIGKPPIFQPKTKGHIVSVASSRPRVGKSTAAVFLASALARQPNFVDNIDSHKICVLDLDVMDGELQNIMKSTTKGSMGIYESGVISKQSILENVEYNEKLGIHILPISNKKMNASDYLGEQFFSKLLDELKQIFNVIVIDTESNDIAHSNQKVFDISDVVILASTVDRSAEYGVRSWLQSYAKHNQDVKKVTALLTNTPKLQVMANLDDIRKTFSPLSIVGNVPMDSVGLLNALKRNDIAGLFENGNKVAESYLLIADRLAENQS
jgi:Mrp family chromosome partitioning ATPase